ncbi:MAG: EAL domain-containing protein [Frankiales bacterium]|nr:EAL domain-containing protein [Frankiales bacterium]
MAAARVSRATVAVGLDLAIFAAGLLLAVPAVVLWIAGGGTLDPTALLCVGVVVVMSRFPLVIAHGSGNVVIGFDPAVLVFLSLALPPVEAFALWAVSATIANATQRKSWRSRIFNVGITILGGAVFMAIVTAAGVRGGDLGAQLVAVMVACAVYFTVDLLVTAGSLALEGDVSLGSLLRWSSVSLGLATFVSVDTLGFLAWLLVAQYPSWTLLLLVVPVGTILVAVRSVSETRIAQRRLVGLLEAATQAPDWTDDAQIEASLVVQAERTLRRGTAVVRDEPAEGTEIGAAIEVEGRPTRHLVVTPHTDAPLDERDRAALEALTAVGVSAFNRRRLSDEMTYLARHDALTGLTNRAVFLDRLALSLAQRAPRGLVAVLYVDLDGFKEVNDLLGHDTGDGLLVQVAQRILGCLRSEDVAARLGGDEFGILLDDLTGEAQAEHVARRILDALDLEFSVGDRTVRVRASIGIAFAGAEPVTAEMLVNNADTAMYVAKSRGKSRAELFHATMREAELGRLQLEAAVRTAVLEDRITVQYQPVVDLVTGHIDGFEALARWHDPDLGQVPPNVFVAAAERIGLIGTLGSQILEQAHAGGRELARAAGRSVNLGVNLSPLQVTDPDVARRVGELHRLAPDVRLVLELTEGVYLGDDADTVTALHRLRAAGARLAIDDFGVGYSSVGYLHRLPVDILKLDKLFVSELHDPRSLALVQGVVAMAQAMNLTVVTEGVEEWAGAAALRALHCDLAQGYVFSRPLDLPEALELARAGSVDLSPLGRERVASVTRLRP